MLTNWEIALNADMIPIQEIAERAGIEPGELEPYGRHKAKVSPNLLSRLESARDGKLVLVTSMTPTPAGEGKTTVTIGLVDAIQRLGLRACGALREPSLGPCFGIKGGATGGGYAQVLPMDEINLHFTGDFHAVEAANNLLAAMVDNHVYHGNPLGIEPDSIPIVRCLDMNDRNLRFIVTGLHGPFNGLTRESGFEITAASEVMAILSLGDDLADVRRRFGNILVGEDPDGKPIFARQLKAEGAMAALMRQALKPNLVQTIEHSPCLIHAGSFGNVANGSSSITSLRMALKLADYVVTEAGFGTDLGAEKFFDVVCRHPQLKYPDAAVLVATTRALKVHGGASPPNLHVEDMAALEAGFCNLDKHVEILRTFGGPFVVAVNRFASDTDAEIARVCWHCEEMGAAVVVTEARDKGSEGALQLAEVVRELCASDGPSFHALYPLEMSLPDKIRTIAMSVYGASGVEMRNVTRRRLAAIEDLGLGNAPVCIAKTQSSLSDDPKALGRPKDFKLIVTGAKPFTGAGYVVAYAGDIMTMPGLPASPAAQSIDALPDGTITGLF